MHKHAIRICTLAALLLTPGVLFALEVAEATNTHIPEAQQYHAGAVAHRGFNTRAPENTYAAGQMCIDTGVEYVEIDVRRTKDGVHVVLHDSTVDRTTDGSGAIRDMTWAQVKKLDAGSWYGEEFKGQRIPRVDEYLAWAKGRIKVYLDVKDADVEHLLKLVDNAGMREQVFAWSGSRSTMSQMRQLASWLPIKVNVKTADEVRKAKSWGAAIVEYRADVEDMDALIEACESTGIIPMAYITNDNREDFEIVIRHGAKLVNLNHPDVFFEVLSQIQQDHQPIATEPTETEG